MSVATDEELMRAYAAGQSTAFAELYARHERGVYRFLLRSLAAEPAVADELLQEVWLSVVRHAGHWEPRARFITWLYGIARNRLIDHWRARRDHLSLDAADEESTPLAETLPASRVDEPEVRLLSREAARAFNQAVEALPVAQREAFLLHAEAGLAIEDIARLTGVGTETAKSRLRYALAKLRSALETWS